MTFQSRLLRGALLAGAAFCAQVQAHAAVADADEDQSRTLSGLVVQPLGDDAQRPLSSHSVSAEQIAVTVNATTAEDTLKYLPSILVRRRHIGDTQAPISTRTSGVGASARSLIYADGVLLSALIGNNNSTASPRWGMVAPDEITRVDVLYGPFSAAYAGNSIGAVVNITTRAPQAFEAQGRVAGGVQAFGQYGTKGEYPVREASLGLGDRRGAFSWRFSVNHLESDSQPLSYITAARPASTSAAGAPTTGAIDDRNRLGAPIAVLGAGGLERQQQDNAKLKLAWEPGEAFKARYLLGSFTNDTEAHVETYLRNAAGAPVYSGALNLGGYAYNVAASAFANGMYRLDEQHWMQALTLEGAASPQLRWQAIATVYDYGRDEQRTPSTALPGALNGGAGTILDLAGTGWRTLDAKAVWSPQGPLAAHTVTVGAHHDRYVLGSDRYNTADWIAGTRGALAAASHGTTETGAAFIEDAIRLTPELSLTFGLRQERWRAFDGLNYSLAPALTIRQPERSADGISPKAVLSWAPDADWRVTASVGRAYRFPTVSELYQAVTVGQELKSPTPDLEPERSLSTELSAQRTWKRGTIRVSAFTEDISQALISQQGFVTGSTTLVSFVQNIDKVRSRGVEVAGEFTDALPGLDLSASATFVDSGTARDRAFTAAEGKQTPQVPRLRWTAVATWRATERLTLTGAARYSDRVFATLDNVDTVGHTFQGFEGYLVLDARATFRLDRHWSAAVGVDNLNNRDYFIFHPFPQRSVLAELHYVY